jgi:hypothetical protein
MFRKRKNEEAVQILNKHANALSDEALKRIEELKVITMGLDIGWETQIRNKTSDIIALESGRAAILKTISVISKKKTEEEVFEGLKFQISSIFLRECWEFTTSDPAKRERLLIITGPVTPDGTRILSRVENIPYDKQSAGYVSADLSSSHKALVSLSEKHGHLLLALFHSHISKGASSTSPSAVDIRNMERKHRDGILCLGGIFSLDGFVRFFTVDDDFSIDVYGKGVDLIESQPKNVLFKITDMGSPS